MDKSDKLKTTMLTSMLFILQMMENYLDFYGLIFGIMDTLDSVYTNKE